MVAYPYKLAQGFCTCKFRMHLITFIAMLAPLFKFDLSFSKVARISQAALPSLNFPLY